MLQITQQQISQAFTEWLVRYKDDPAQFEEEYSEAGEYGETSAAYLLKLIDEQGKE